MIKKIVVRTCVGCLLIIGVLGLVNSLAPRKQTDPYKEWCHAVMLDTRAKVADELSEKNVGDINFCVARDDYK